MHKIDSEAANISVQTLSRPRCDYIFSFSFSTRMNFDIFSIGEAPGPRIYPQMSNISQKYSFSTLSSCVRGNLALDATFWVSLSCSSIKNPIDSPPRVWIMVFKSSASSELLVSAGRKLPEPNFLCAFTLSAHQAPVGMLRQRYPM